MPRKRMGYDAACYYDGKLLGRCTKADSDAYTQMCIRDRVQADLKKLRDIRYWVRKATPGTEESKAPPKKQPIKEVLQDKADEKKAQKNAPAQTKHKQQDMEL